MVALCAVAVLGGCAGARESGAFSQWLEAERELNIPRAQVAAEYSHHDAASRAIALPDGAGLEAYLAYALRHSPALHAAFDRWKAALEQVPQARALPEPQLTFAFFVEQIESRRDPTGERYGLAQAFPWFGTLALRGEAALHEALAEQQRFEAERLVLRRRVSRAFHERRYLERAIEIAREQRELAIHLERTAQSRFRAGTAGQADVSRAQVELGRLDDQLRSLEDLRGVVAAELNAAIGRPAQAPLPRPPLANEMPFEPTVLVQTDEQLLALAGQVNPELEVHRHEIARERRGIELARKAYWPDFMLGIEYGRNSGARMARMERMAGIDGGGTDMLAGMITIDVPIWREKYDAGVAEALAKFGSATRSIVDHHYRIEAGLKRALYDFRDAGRKIDLYGRTLLPKAREALRTSEAAYRAGEIGFSDLVDTQRVLLEFALAHERAMADHHQMLAELEMLVGQPLEVRSAAAGDAAEEKEN